MCSAGPRLNVPPDSERASMALDEANPDARHVAALLDGIPGAYERARQGLKQARDGDVIALDELAGFLALTESTRAGSGAGGRSWTRDELYER